MQGALLKALADAPNTLKQAVSLATVNTVSNAVHAAENNLLKNHQANVTKVAGLLNSQLQKLTQEFAAQLKVAQEIDEDVVTKTRNVQKELSAALTKAQAQVTAANLEALKSAEANWKVNHDFNTKLANLPGDVVIHTVPEQAAVTVNGKTLSGKQLLFAGLRLGTHLVKIQADDYETTNFMAVVRVSSKTGKPVPANYSVTLTRSLGTLELALNQAGATYTLTMTGPNELIGQRTPPITGQIGSELTRRLPTGDYSVELKKEGFITVKTNATVGVQQMARLQVRLEEDCDVVTLSDGMELAWVENLTDTPIGGYVGVYEVTQEQYIKLMGNNPSKFQAPSFPENLKRPVESASWNEAADFCAKLTKREQGKLPKGKADWVFALPTNKQWEHFATNTIANSVTSFGRTTKTALGISAEVKSKSKNQFGLKDTRGNVWELVRIQS